MSGNTHVALPGIGSYIALAIEQQNLRAIGWAIATMLIVILVYDQLLFRPLVAWVDRFRVEQEPGRRAAGILGADDDAPLATDQRAHRVVLCPGALDQLGSACGHGARKGSALGRSAPA